VGHTLLKQLFDGRAVGDLDVVGESAAVVVDEEHLHEESFLLGGRNNHGGHGGTEKKLRGQGLAW